MGKMKIKVISKVLANTKDPKLDGLTERQGLRLMQKEGAFWMNLKNFRRLVRRMQKEP